MTSSVKLLVAFFVLTLISCDKDLFPEDLQVHFEDNFPIKDIVSRNGYWLACGGETFESGYVISSQFENEEAFIVSIHSKCVNSIDIYGDTYLSGVYGVGFPLTEDWVFNSPELFIMRESLLWNNHIYSVGGAGLSSGVIYTFDVNLNLMETILLDNDLSFIREIDDRIFVGGFGRLMYTDDFQTWTIIDAYEDHFIDIEISEEIGLLVLGASGRLIRSIDVGVTWTEILAPNFSGISDFSDLLVTEDKIYLAGDEKICVSEIDNIKFQTIVLESMGEINKMAENNKRLFFVTNKGKVASIAY